MNMTVDTVAYAAPEQLMGEKIDGRADQYALAATAFHLLTGAPPYQHSNPVAVISQHLSEPPPKLSGRRPELASLDQAFETALAKHPNERFPRCRDFAKALSDRVSELPTSDRATEAGVTIAAPVAAPPKPSPAPAPGPKPSWLRPTTGTAVVVGLILIGVLIFVGIPLSRPRQTPTPPPAASVTPTLTPTSTPPAPHAQASTMPPPAPPPISSTISTTVPFYGSLRGRCSDGSSMQRK